MNVRELLKQTLEEAGFEGLTSGECACFLDDLVPCENDFGYCLPGHKVPCPGPEHCELGKGCAYHIKAGPKKS